MRKSTIFISAVLTTFALVMIYSVVSAYRNNQKTKEVSAAAVDPTATLAASPADAPSPAQAFLSPVQAAQRATQVIGNVNLLSAESSNLNGTDAYKITFTNNDVVYVGLDGQILSVQVAPQVVNVALPETQSTQKHNDSHATSHESSEHGTSAESHEEHED